MFSSFFILFFLFSSVSETGTFPFPVSETADFLVVPLSQSSRFEIRCDTESPKTVQKWRESSGAKIVINAGFFDKSFLPVGFTKTAQKSWGSVSSHPGIFSVFSDGEADILRSDSILRNDLLFAASGFPLLVWENKNQFLQETEKYDRRTIVARKKNRIYFFVSVRGHPSLAESAAALQKFGVEKALNLDGGTSTGFSSQHREIYSVPVPCAILSNS